MVHGRGRLCAARPLDWRRQRIRTGRFSASTIGTSPILNNRLGKYVAKPNELTGAKSGPIKQDRGEGGGLPASVLAAGVPTPGTTGPTGPAGSNATVNGVAAGGALSGTYPSPGIADGAVNGAKIAAGSIGDEKLSDIDLFGDSFVRATLAAGGDFAAAQAAAPKVPLWSKGQLSAYGKCFSSTDGPESYARVYMETSAAGAILSTTSAAFGAADLDGEPFLDPGTDESDRALGTASAGAGSFRQKQLSQASFVAMSPDGTVVDGLASAAVKRSGPNGIYGPGQSCLFSGFGIG